MAAPIGVDLRIFGRVQGVGYRDWAMQVALRLALAGWVRNLTDGSVQAFVYGPEEAIAAFTAACQAGPAMARVQHVHSSRREQWEPVSGFRQLPTTEPGD